MELNPISQVMSPRSDLAQQSAVHRELETFTEARHDDDTVRVLGDELLCAKQASSLRDQRLRAELGRALERHQRQEECALQLEQRLEQVTAMGSTTAAELHQELRPTFDSKD
eukprot:118759-Amphidinium_carterae.1